MLRTTSPSVRLHFLSTVGQTQFIYWGWGSSLISRIDLIPIHKVLIQFDSILTPTFRNIIISLFKYFYSEAQVTITKMPHGLSSLNFYIFITKKGGKQQQQNTKQTTKTVEKAKQQQKKTSLPTPFPDPRVLSLCYNLG